MGIVLISVGILVIGMFVLVGWARRGANLSQATEEILLEGASLSDVPSLDQLLSDMAARDAIKSKVVEVGFNACASVAWNGNTEFQTAEAFLIDDGGGVHTIEEVVVTTTTSAALSQLETKAAKLAESLGVRFRA